MRYLTLFGLFLFLTVQIVNAKEIKASMLLSEAAFEKKMPLLRSFDGVVEAIHKATISSEVSGRVSKLNFDIDDVVKKNAIILVVRDTEYKAAFDAAKAAYSEASAKQKDAELEFDRIKGLYRDKMVPASQFDSARANLKSAEARVASSKAQISQAQEQLNNTKIRAPYSGIVVNRYIELGEMVIPGQKVMTGFSLEKLRVSVDIPQSIHHSVRRYKHAEIIPFVQYDNKISSSNMTFFPYANPETHSVKVRINLTPGLKNLMPGMMVKVKLLTGESSRLLIPSSAIVNRGEVEGLYVINGDHIQFRQIRAGLPIAEYTEVLAGLAAGEQVALEPIKAAIVYRAKFDKK